MKKFKLVTLLGIRPDIIRMFKLVKLLDDNQKRFNYTHVFAHTGQHYDYELDGIFYRELGVRHPDINLGVGKNLKESGQPLTHTHLISLLFIKVSGLIEKERPDAVLYLGDTNTVLTSMVVSRYQVPVIHIEGGGRSFDWRMPEEKIRMVTDHLSDMIYCYLPRYREILLSEGIPSFRIKVVGNIIDDALKQFFPKASEKIFKDLGLTKGNYGLVTIHREENISVKNELTPRIEDLIKLSKELPVVFPVMPRVEKALKAFGLFSKFQKSKIIKTKPLGFLEFLALEKEARVIITDSGTVQEEALILGIPCLVTRRSTERPETIEAGASIMSEKDLYENALKAMALKRSWNRNILNPFGTSPSDLIFKDLVKKIKSGFFKESRTFKFIGRNPFTKKAYGKLRT